MQRGPQKREAHFLQFTTQRHGTLIYIPHLLAYAGLNLDADSPTMLSGWDAAFTRNQLIIVHKLDEYFFGERRGK